MGGNCRRERRPQAGQARTQQRARAPGPEEQLEAAEERCRSLPRAGATCKAPSPKAAPGPRRSRLAAARPATALAPGHVQGSAPRDRRLSVGTVPASRSGERGGPRQDGAARLGVDREPAAHHQTAATRIGGEVGPGRSTRFRLRPSSPAAPRGGRAARRSASLPGRRPSSDQRVQLGDKAPEALSTAMLLSSLPPACTERELRGPMASRRPGRGELQAGAADPAAARDVRALVRGDAACGCPDATRSSSGPRVDAWEAFGAIDVVLAVHVLALALTQWCCGGAAARWRSRSPRGADLRAADRLPPGRPPGHPDPRVARHLLRGQPPNRRVLRAALHGGDGVGREPGGGRGRGSAHRRSPRPRPPAPTTPLRALYQPAEPPRPAPVPVPRAPEPEPARPSPRPSPRPARPAGPPPGHPRARASRSPWRRRPPHSAARPVARGRRRARRLSAPLRRRLGNRCGYFERNPQLAGSSARPPATLPARCRRRREIWPPRCRRSVEGARPACPGPKQRQTSPSGLLGVAGAPRPLARLAVERCTTNSGAERGARDRVRARRRAQAARRAAAARPASTR